jgi:hypothetical protein
VVLLFNELKDLTNLIVALVAKATPAIESRPLSPLLGALEAFEGERSSVRLIVSGEVCNIRLETKLINKIKWATKGLGN